MENSLIIISNWCGCNGLKINSVKTQLLVLGTREMICRLAPTSVDFCGSTVTATISVRNLGVWFDSDTSFATDTDDVVRRCTGPLCGLSHSHDAGPEPSVFCAPFLSVCVRIEQGNSARKVTEGGEIRCSSGLRSKEIRPCQRCIRSPGLAQRRRYVQVPYHDSTELDVGHLRAAAPGPKSCDQTQRV